MFERVEFMAESGAKPLGLASYDIWVVFLGIGGASFGAALGGVAQGLLRLWTLMRPAVPTLRRRSAAAAVAGGILGGATGTLVLMVIAMVLGAITPAAADGIGLLRTRMRR
jgi:hypothetical protein